MPGTPTARSRAAFGYAAAVLLPVAVVVLACKLLKLQGMAGHAGQPVDLSLQLAAVAQDLRLLGVWLALAGGLGALLPAAVAGASRVLHHLLASAVCVVAAAEHGFYATTGSLLDWPMVTYTWAHFAMLKRVLLSEFHAGMAAGLLVLATVNLWPLLVPRLRAVWRASGPLRPLQNGAAALVLAGLALLLPRLAGPLPPMLRPLGPVAVVALAQGPWQPPAKPVYQGGIAAPIQPLVVKAGPRTKPHNVVLVVLESLRADVTGLYGNRKETTPLLDRLAKTGVVVERAYTTVPHTTKSLVPIHCGIYPSITPFFEEAAAGALPSDCLAAVLQRLGWATAYFQTSESYFEQNRQLIQNFGFAHSVDRDSLKPTAYEEINYFGYEDQALVEPALKWVDAQKTPFFMGMITLASHHPYSVPKAFAQSRPPAQGQFGLYLEAVRYSDEALASLIAGFEKRGLIDKTLFVFIGDHGEGFGEHGLNQHDGLVYEEATKVPLLLWGAGLKPQRIQGLRQNIDVLPTVLDVLGLEVLAGSLPGHSVLSHPGHRELFFSCWHRDMCLGHLQGNRKTIWHYDKKGAEVFDLVADPAEKKNLAANDAKGLAATVAAMQAWKTAVNARHEGQARFRQAPLVQTTAPPLKQTLNMVFSLPNGKPAVAIRSVEVTTPTIGVGETASVTVVYEVLHTLDASWNIFVHGHSSTAQFSRHDHVPAEGTHPVAAWRAGQFITDRLWLRPPPGQTPGEMDITLGFYQPDVPGARMAVAGEGLALPAGAPDKLLLATLQVTDATAKLPPRLPASHNGYLQAGLSPLAHNLQAEFGAGAVRLVHSSSVPPQPVVGQTFDLTLGWEVLRRLPRHTEMFMHLRGPNNRHQNIAQVALSDLLPADKWRAGDALQDIHRLRVPADWPAGPLEVWVGFWGPNLDPRNGRMPVVGPALDVDSAERYAVAIRLTTQTVAAPGLPPAKPHWLRKPGARPHAR